MRGVPLPAIRSRAVPAVAVVHTIIRLSDRATLVAVVAVRTIRLVALAWVGLLVGPLAGPAVPAAVSLARRVLLGVLGLLPTPECDLVGHAASLYGTLRVGKRSRT